MLFDLGFTSIAVSPGNPFFTDDYSIGTELCLVATPHLYDRVIYPPIIEFEEVVENGYNLNTLFPQALSVQAHGGLCEIKVR